MIIRAFPNLAHAVLYPMLVGTAFAATAVVKPTCTISWGPTTDSRVTEYHVTISRVGDTSAKKSTHVVKAPVTHVSCQEVGANKPGRWQATVQACLQDGACSAESKPISFKVVEK
jgi:hypothetical protein